ncbi:protein SLOW GREEN 1, chloroplastic-like [Phoenix dactylifera]|uniref:Protein SLOW GREEN 1, chloroplastic-like n=1 Tax=Phoenix dactylifera TaxID=42345 RepID=A0A8B7C0C7_PHODC|nr:protein SLOW GREEN 1, chloroplastic-like [Phoenix dactylifera]
MESICRVHHHPIPRHLSLFSRPAFSKPLFSLKPFSPKPRPPLSFRASYTSAKTPDHLSSLLRPAGVALAAAAALLLARLHGPAPAAAASPLPAAVQPETLPSSPASADPETLAEAEEERTLEEYLDSHPDDVRSLRALMELKVKSQKLPEAIDIVDRLVALEPGEKDLPLLKAHLQSYSGDAETAKQGFEEILQQDPFCVEAYHGLVMVASQSEESDEELDGILKRVEEAMEMCKKEKKKEELRDFELLVAQIRVTKGKYEEALKLYEELVKEEPGDFRPYLCQGIIYTLLRKKDAAEKQFQKYQRLVPKGHPYARYFEENMMAMKIFGQMEENKRKGSFKS